MSYQKSAPRFPAVLKSLDDQIVSENGLILISPENHSVDFKSDFIPLYKMGEKLKLVRIQDGVEVVTYTGEVYLSSPHILRLVNVTEEYLPGAHLVFSYDVELPAQILARVLRKPSKKIFCFKTKPKYHEACFTATVHSLARRQIKFTTDQQLEENQIISISMDIPPLEGVHLTIRKTIDLGQTLRSYHCTIQEISFDSERNLEEYICNLSEQKGQVFH